MTYLYVVTIRFWFQKDIGFCHYSSLWLNFFPGGILFRFWNMRTKVDYLTLPTDCCRFSTRAAYSDNSRQYRNHKTTYECLFLLAQRPVNTQHPPFAISSIFCTLRNSILFRYFKVPKPASFKGCNTSLTCKFKAFNMTLTDNYTTLFELWKTFLKYNNLYFHGSIIFDRSRNKASFHILST